MKFTLTQTLLLVVLLALLVGLTSSGLRMPVSQDFVAICFSPDSKLLAIQGTHNTQVFEIESGQKIANFRCFGVANNGFVKFVDNQHLIVFGHVPELGNRAVTWFDVKSRQQVKRLEFVNYNLTEHFTPGHDGFFYDNNELQSSKYFSYQPDESLPLFSGSIAETNRDPSVYQTLDQELSFFNGTLEGLKNPKSKFSAMKIENVFRFGSKIMLGKDAGLSRVSPDRKFLLVPKGTTYALHHFDSGNIIWHTRMPHNQAEKSLPPTTIKFSANSKYVSLRYGQAPKELRVFDCPAGKQLLTVTLPFEDFISNPFGISNSGLMATGNGTQNGVGIWNSQTKDKVTQIGRARPPFFWLGPAALYTIGFVAWAWFWATAYPIQSQKPFGASVKYFMLLAGTVSVFLGAAIMTAWSSNFLASSVVVFSTIIGCSFVTFQSGLLLLTWGWRLFSKANDAARFTGTEPSPSQT